MFYAVRKESVGETLFVFNTKGERDWFVEYKQYLGINAKSITCTNRLVKAMKRNKLYEYFYYYGDFYALYRLDPSKSYKRANL